ncbi:ORF3 [Indomegoura indica nege-like virus 1]|nr:ORF3 [Indomegoura indica nege-like virus 1]
MSRVNAQRNFVPSRQFVRQSVSSKPSRPYITKIVRSPLPKQNAVRKVKRSTFDLNNIFTDILNSITKAVSNPAVLLTFAVALSIIINHDFSAKSGYIYTTFSGKTDGFSVWIVANAKKICGFLIFLPTILDIPKDKKAIVAIASFLWVFMIPEYVFAEYLLQSLLLHTYFKVSSKHTRIALLVAAGFAWFAGFITFKTTTLPNVPNTRH